ncbi:MAG: hypothetical protein ACOZNI_16250 [Myxococcota bacterium]
MSMRYTFHGVVLPERAQSGTVSGFTLHSEPLVGEASVSIRVEISNAQLAVIVEDEGTGLDVWTLKNSVESVARRFVDTLGFFNFASYDVEIRSAILPDGTLVVFGVGHDDLTAFGRPLLSASGLTELDVLQVLTFDTPAHLALADLREGNRSPDDTGFFCFRAVESIRQAFVNCDLKQDKRDGASWTTLRRALRLERTFFERLQTFALPRRHGALVNLTGEDRTGLLKNAWTVVFRYIMLRKFGLPDLPEDDAHYPVLK